MSPDKERRPQAVDELQMRDTSSVQPFLNKETANDHEELVEHVVLVAERPVVDDQ